jgi:hypothetical protein
VICRHTADPLSLCTTPVRLFCTGIASISVSLLPFSFSFLYLFCLSSLHPFDPFPHHYAARSAHLSLSRWRSIAARVSPFPPRPPFAQRYQENGLALINSLWGRLQEPHRRRCRDAC